MFATVWSPVLFSRRLPPHRRLVLPWSPPPTRSHTHSSTPFPCGAGKASAPCRRRALERRVSTERATTSAGAPAGAARVQQAGRAAVDEHVAARCSTRSSTRRCPRCWRVDELCPYKSTLTLARRPPSLQTLSLDKPFLPTCPPARASRAVGWARTPRSSRRRITPMGRRGGRRRVRRQLVRRGGGAGQQRADNAAGPRPVPRLTPIRTGVSFGGVALSASSLPEHYGHSLHHKRHRHRHERDDKVINWAGGHREASESRGDFNRIKRWPSRPTLTLTLRLYARRDVLIPSRPNSYHAARLHPHRQHPEPRRLSKDLLPVGVLLDRNFRPAGGGRHGFEDHVDVPRRIR